MVLKKFSPHSKVRKSSFFQAAVQVCILLQKQGVEAYLVGGCVRDFILKPYKLPKDIDIATSARPHDIMRLFPQSSYVGENFGVCLVKFMGFQFEVTTFRTDGEYLDKRRPERIAYGNLHQDSCRRDFTMNAIYYNPIKRQLIDFHDGLRHIRQRLICCVGNAAQRLNEDSLRVLRALRFSANLNFSIECKTSDALTSYSIHVTEMAKERILLELSKVHNRFLFMNLFVKYFPITYFFNIPINIIEKEKKFQNKFYYSEKFIFLNFLLYIFSFYEIDQENNQIIRILHTQLKIWPLSKKDSLLCHYYLSLIHFDKFSHIQLSSEVQSQFFIFSLVLKLRKISHKATFDILKNLKLIWKNKNHVFFINFLLKNFFNNFKISEHQAKISHDIILKMSEEHISAEYTQIYIDLYCYYDFVNKENFKENFVQNNFVFVKKIKPIIGNFLLVKK
jgi:tRNA nucleotidyltransferase (CCA-adding enzyme)